MNILLAPDSYKGSISAKKICDIAEKAIIDVIPDCNITKMPLADGGEGTVDCLANNLLGEYKEKIVKGPNGKKVTAKYSIIKNNVAIIEMASASGLELIKENELNPLKASSFGTGQLIYDAVENNCKEIVVAIGGSATNDAGLGMLKALGFRFYDKEGNQIKEGASELIKIFEIDDSKVKSNIKNARYTVACDVDNPFTGPNGATMVYGKQKGADNQMLRKIENGMINFCNVVKREYNINLNDVPGSGAAGGMGGALFAFLNAKLKPGFDIINELIGIEKLMKNNNYSYIFTGEGEINKQTLNGKLPYRIAQLGEKYNIPVIIVVGKIGEGIDEIYKLNIAGIFSIINGPMSLNNSIENTQKLVYETFYNLSRTLKIVNK